MSNINKKYSTDVLKNFLNASKSAYHVVDFAKEYLEKQGFEKISLDERFELKEGGRYYCIPYDTTLFAFCISKDIKSGKMHISCAHTDSPSYKIKPVPDMGARANVARINVEPYGGALKRTWFDRPLGVAGKVVLRGKSIFCPENVLFDSAEPWFIIPSLAPHMDREIEEKKIDPQKELIPICALETNDSEVLKNGLKGVIAKALEVSDDDILDYDLGLYVCEEAKEVGIGTDFLLSPRVDNVASVAALVQSLAGEKVEESVDYESEDDNDISLIALFDNEEVGSRTKQGADSMILKWVIDRIYGADIFSNIDKMSALTKSKMLSVDGAHAVHPNYPEKADETCRAFLGKGVVLKTSASQRYVSDANMSGILTMLCEKYDIGLQKQANKSGTPGGQTLGPIESSYLPIPAADLGVPMLAMHSCVETMAISDYEDLLSLMRLWNSIG